MNLLLSTLNNYGRPKEHVEEWTKHLAVLRRGAGPYEVADRYNKSNGKKINAPHIHVALTLAYHSGKSE